MRKIFIILLAGILNTSLLAQNPVVATKTEALLRLEQKEIQQRKQSLMKNIQFENIGPSVMSGRVVDLAVNPSNSNYFYVAFASSGLWRTKNNGQSFEPLFQYENVMSIGDIAVDWKNGEKIWIGTGENNSSRSSYYGTGIYLSTDTGKTWQSKGLVETEHIGRIVLHPTDPNTIFVAAIGHLYSPNKQRGVFVTSDGGNTWKRSLFINENTGAIDLIIDPEDPNNLYAAAWYRKRRAWNFEEAGDGSGIYKTADGGKSWVKLSTNESGFPANEKIGRIGLAVFSKNGKKVLYAVVDNQNFRPKVEMKIRNTLKKEDFANISEKKFTELDEKKLESFLRQNNFPRKYTAKSVKKMVAEGKIMPMDIKIYLEDENAMLFDTPIIGIEVYRSDNEGNTWQRTHDDYLDDIFYTYGYYFGQIRVSANQPNKIYILGVPLLTSEDGGKTFKSINSSNVHADHHALWLDQENDGHLILGNDGGINITYDNGKNWINANSLNVGQFYSVAVDMATPYNVYGGLQDNGVWTGPSVYKASPNWHQSGRYPYKSIMGGDGMQVTVDWRDNKTIYTGYQFGNYYRVDKESGKTKSIKPRHELGERPFRFNWQAPIWLSRHNQDIIYFGSNHFHRSLDKGETMETLSGDLTKGGIKGDVSYGTLSSINESALRFGLLYVGSDDGLVHVSKDGGYNWENISKGLPENMWVTRVWASAHKEGRVYVSLSGLRWDNFSPYVFVSDNYGKKWKNISANLPLEAVNVVKEDPKNEDILYVGTDHGLYISIDRGVSYQSAGESLPRVAVHDIAFQTRENDLLAGTHGRSIYKADISALEQLNSDILSKKLYVFDIESVRFNQNWAISWSKWFPLYEPKKQIVLYAGNTGKCTFEVYTENGLFLYSKDFDADKGLNYFVYDLTFDKMRKDNFEQELNNNSKHSICINKADNGKYYLQKAKYSLVFKLNGQEVKKEFEIIENRRIR